MKKIRHKLSPQDHKFIVEQAKLLPNLVRLNKDGKQQGRVLVDFKSVSDFNKDTGTFVKHVERRIEPVYVNHEVEMISAFWDGGQNAVHNYITRVNEIAKRAEAANADGGKQLDKHGMPIDAGKEAPNA